MPTDLSAIAPRRGRKQGCAVCGKRSDTSVVIQARGRDGATLSRSRSFCFSCGSEAFDRTVAALTPPKAGS